jgi:hypothetical protein
MPPRLPKVSFLVVGAQKSGTTTLHHHLAQQPDLYLPDRKELHFFDADSLDWSNPDYQTYEAFFAAATVGQICGEVTPAYMLHRRFLQRIQAYNPEMRLIAILRHPVERAWSNWRMLVTQDAETLPFSQAIREGRTRIAKDWRAYSYVERGFYADQIANMLELFPARNCHFVLTDDLARDPTAAITGICAFLDCPPPRLPVPPQMLRPLESRDLGALSPEDSAYLSRLYADDIRRTARLIGRNLDGWLEQRLL